MPRVAFFIAMLLLPCISFAGSLNNNDVSQSADKEYKKKLIGLPVYLELFKEERLLNLYVQTGETYQLLDSYAICNFSGGLGPKKRQGDLKSPEGFYNVTRNQLKPNSQFYKAINIGFPNTYDRIHGYKGNYLMIHGDCVSVGCYAMTNANIDEIYQFVMGALVFGQQIVQVSIYPFQMTSDNMERHKHSSYADFWRQLKPGYDYFQQTHKPPIVAVMDGRYIIGEPLNKRVMQSELESDLAFSQ